MPSPARSSLSLLYLCCWLGCGSGDGPLDFRDVDPVTEYRIDDAPHGLEQSVVVDSVRWEPLTLNTIVPGELEVEGIYAIYFRNATDQSLQLTYDLRFLDADDFLFDRFIPFGLPVRLDPMESRLESGEFLIRWRQEGVVGLVTTMQIVASVRVAGEGG